VIDLLLVGLIGGPLVLFLMTVIVPRIHASASVGAFLILCVLVTRTAGLPMALPSVGAYQIYVQDILFVILGPVGLYRLLLRRGGLSSPEILLLALGAIVLVSFVRGVGLYGLEFATNSIRTNLYFYSGVLYFCASRIDKAELNRIAIWVLAAAGVLAAIALIQWLFGGAEWVEERLYHGTDQRRTAYSAVRALAAAPTLIVAQAMLIAFAAWSRRVGISGLQLLGIAFLLVIVALPHRSVWVAASIALITLFALESRLRARLPVLLLVGLPFAFLIAPLLAISSNVPFADAIADAVSEPFQANSTFSWRAAGWQNIASYLFGSNIFNILFGLPAGEAAIIDLRRFTFLAHAHNNYLESLTSTGVIGLALMIAFYVALIRKLHTYRSASFDAYVAPKMLVANIALLMGYFLAYSQSYEQSIFVGLAMAFVRSFGIRYPASAETQARGAIAISQPRASAVGSALPHTG